MAQADNEFADYIVDQLGDSLVVSKRMFGGYGVYRDGVFFAIIHDGKVYLKTSARTRKRYLDQGMAPLRATAKQVLTSYYEVPEDVLDDREALHEYAEESWRIASTK